MGIEFAKAYKNFQKFDEERSTRTSQMDSARSSTGLLAPRNGKAVQSSSATTELDKVADYVQQIRKHRMKLQNGEK